MATKRIPELDAAKGIGIFLVCLGHIISAHGQAPLGNDWAITMTELVYTFHMPFFMFLSGFLMYYSYKKISTITGYGKYVIKKFLRFFPAFLIFSLLIFFGKYFSEKVMLVDNPVNNISSYFKIYLTPQSSFSGYLWYIYVLFEFYLIFPILFFISRQHLLIWLPVSLIFSIAIYFINITEFFAIDLIFEYFFIFVLGAVCSKFFVNFIKIVRKFAMIFILIFITVLVCTVNYDIPKIITGVLSIPALFGLITLPFMKHFTHLELWSKYTFAIYLFNTIIIGLLKGIIFKFTSWDYSNFLFVGLVLLAGALYIPVFIKMKFLSHIPYLDKVTN